ncbi:Ig-like domain-containing protein [Bizionia psychrotolerans]|uniref:Ig-like domain-containing protein n=1 Tax=Bizionia psychrotolerans TaxID=1492901 RepID=UPI00069EE510|nr:Ig-like domain-containing protein [Bizionia psychrotolerans]
MKKKYIFLFISIFLLLSCKSEDDDYVEVQIQTQDDTAQVFQGGFIEMDVLSNDSNIPETGTLTITNSAHATISILNNNTPNNPSDDKIRYTPTGDYLGADSFVYTICSSNNNCATGTITVTILPVSPVVYNPDDLPYPNLSDYNFFEGDLKNLNPVSGVIPYDLNSPLFSDYAHKKRFVWMPNGSKASFESDYTPLEFPIGAFLIKNFYYDNVLPTGNTQIIETRLMYFTETGWEFAKYVWNDEQTEATFSNDGSFVNLTWNEGGSTKNVNYRIPSRAECFTCHNKFGTPIPIGPKPQNLNKTYMYQDGTENQLQKWVDVGYLNPDYPGNIDSTVAWDDTLESLELRARSYIDINCAHCHSEESYCEYRPMRFAFNENDLSSNMGICVEPDTNIGDEYPLIMNPRNADASVVVFRMSSIEEQYRMPLLGRTLQHTEGIALITEWINSLADRCN